MRVIAGSLRGRALITPPGMRTRPTTARVRRSLFDMLAPVLPGAACLDLFAGSGALGIEALSRGAGGCWFVERDRQALRVLEANLERLGLKERSRVVAGDVLQVLGRVLVAHGRPFDLVLADPPYGQDLAGRILEMAGSLRLVGRGGYFVIQHGSREELPERVPNLALFRCSDFGETLVSVYEVCDRQGGDDATGGGNP